jgi:hypothetical protein
MWTPIALLLVGFLSNLAAFVTASPVADSINTHGKTFSIPLTHNVNVVRHGPSEVLKTLRKYKQNIPEGLQEAVDKHHAKISQLATAEDSKISTPDSLPGLSISQRMACFLALD